MNVNSSRGIVYVVDDDCDLGAPLARLLRRWGYAAEPFHDDVQLLAAYSAAKADCILTDVMMGELDGFGFADQLRTIDPAAAIVFMTAWPTTSSAVDSVRRYGGVDYLEKPVDEQRLMPAISEGVSWSQKKAGPDGAHGLIESTRTRGVRPSGSRAHVKGDCSEPAAKSEDHRRSS